MRSGPGPRSSAAERSRFTPHAKVETAAAGGGELVSVIDDSGYDATITGSPTLLLTATANTAFRGVAFAPAP